MRTKSRRPIIKLVAPTNNLGEKTKMIERLQAKRNEEGFTLIELLIVIIVLGILAAIVVFAVGSTKKDAAASACKTDVKSVELSAEAYNTHEGSYPVGTFNASNATSANLLSGASPANGALLKTFPKSTDYALQYVGTASSYTVQVWNKGDFVAATGVPNAAPAAPLATGCAGL